MTETVLYPERLIGEGSSGSVYLARNPEGRPFALKILKGTSSSMLSLWENEVSLLVKLRHPNLVEVIGFSRDGREVRGQEGSPCYWMEFIQGAPLTDAAKSAEPSRIAGWLRQALEALDYLHTQGVLHGDLKPSNILIDANDRVKLIDFGLSTILQAASGNYSHNDSHTVRGTLTYLAPEILEGNYGPASDLFSLGTSFYEAFTGVHPRGNARDLSGLYGPPSRSLAASGIALAPVVRKIARVVDRMIEADTAIRWKTAREALAALDQDRPKFKATRGPASTQSFRLFGRTEALSRIEEFIRSCRERNEPSIILVHGLTGAGKSRFTQECYYHWALQGLPVVLSRPPAEGILLHHDSEPAADEWRIRIFAESETLRPPHLKEIREFLRTSRRGFDVLVLEYNDEYLPASLKDVFHGLIRERNVLDLRLENLSRDDAALLLHSLLRSEIGDKMVQEIFAVTQGNPKLLTSLCQELAASGYLDSKRSSRGALQKAAVPQTVDSFFEKRLRGLTSEERRTLTFLATAAGSASTDELLSLTELSRQALREALGRLIDLGLAEIGEAALLRYRIVHPLLAQIVRRSLSPLDDRKLHARWIDLLESENDRPETETTIALAGHAVEIPSHPQRMKWIFRAGEILHSREEESAAAALFEKGLPLADTREDRETLLRNLANAYGWMGEFQKSRSTIEKWFEEYPSDALGLNPVKYGLSTGVACKNLGDPAEAARRLQFALEHGDLTSETHRPYLARAHSLLGLLKLDANDFSGAEAHFQDALRLLPETNELRAEVCKHRAMMSAKRRSWTEAESHLDAAEKIYRDLGHTKGLFAVAMERGNFALKAGARESAETSYGKAFEIASRANDEASLARVHQNFGLLAVREGDLATAIEEYDQARELLVFFGSPRERAMNSLELAATQASVGNFSTSRELREEAAREGDSFPDVAARAKEVAALIDFLEKGIPCDIVLDPEGSLEEIHRKLPDALKIGFEERFDYKKWVTEREQKIKQSPQEILEPGKIPEIGETVEIKERDDMEILQKMHALTHDLFASNDMGQILARVLDAAMDLSKAERGFLVVPSEGASGPLPGFEIKVARNLARETLEAEDSRISLSVVREALRTGQPQVTDNALQDLRFGNAPSVQQLELKSILVLPLKGSQGVSGAIYLDHRFEARIFRGADLQILQVFADQAALALQKARLIEKLETSNQTLTHTVTEQTDELTHLRREVEDQREKLSYEYREIIGRAPKMLEVLFLVDRLIESSIPVWIFGESGTGKEMIARALHFKGARRKKPFVSENCSALPEQLLESELFGHKKGAFTHADRDKKGLLQYADGGTVFLDEIADMSAAMQAKILRFLQEKEFRPLGSNETVRVDVRIVSASNKDLSQLVREGKFREDLFYRLNGVTVHLPPLRERSEDIPLLARHFLKKVAEAEKKEPLELAPDSLELLMGYPWPGNVRELENSLQTACLFHVKGKLVAKSFHFKKALFEEAPPAQASTAISAGPQPSKAIQAPSTPPLSEDARLLLKALQDNCYHKGLAAKKLGITRRYLYKKLTKLGIPVDRVKMKAYIEKQEVVI